MRASFLFAILAVFAASALAQNQLPEPLFGFSGNWDSTGTMYIPTWASDGTCTLGTSAYHYAWFNYTFAEGGVSRLSSLQDFDYVFAYSNGFNPTNPCQGSAISLIDDSYYVEYSFDAYEMFNSGTYTFVIADYSSYGDFTGQITQGLQGATSNSSGMAWNPIYISSSGACVTEDQTGYQPYYDTTYFNVSATGYWDLNAYFGRAADGSYPSYTYLALFKGEPNNTLQTDACLSTGNDVELIAAAYNSYQYTQLMAVYLVAGQVYTAVVSTYTNAFWGPFGLEITTTRRFNFTLPTSTTGVTVGGFNEPVRTSTPTTCTDNTDVDYDNQPYAVVAFPIPQYQNFTVRTTEPHDYAFFLYGGDNEPPTPCPLTSTYLNYVDSGSSRTYGPYSYDEFTIVATPYYTGVDAAGWYTDVYVVTGPAVTSGGYVPPVTTGSTSGTPVSTTGNVVTTTTGSVVTTTGNTPVTTTTTTSRATTTTTTSRTSTTTSAGSKGASFAGALLILSIFVAMLM